MGWDDGGTFGVVTGVKVFWVYEGRMDRGGDAGLQQHEWWLNGLGGLHVNVHARRGSSTKGRWASPVQLASSVF